MRLRGIASAVALAFFVAGCSGGSGGAGGSSGLVPAPPPPTTAEIFDNNSKSFDAIEARLLARSNTAFDGMPTAGIATFEGNAYIYVDTAPAISELAGDSRIVINFADGTMSGQFDKFVGKDQDGVLDSYTGKLDIVSGTVGEFVPNNIFIDYDGALQGNGDTITMSGYVDGKFKGTPIRGIVANDRGRAVDLNGGATIASLWVVAEKK